MQSLKIEHLLDFGTVQRRELRRGNVAEVTFSPNRVNPDPLPARKLHGVLLIQEPGKGSVMLNLAIYVFLGLVTVVVVVRMMADVRRDRAALRTRIHHEPVIDNIDAIDETDRYYQPAESTDEPIEWLAHQYKKDPLIWDNQDDGFYDNPANRDFSIRVRRKLRMTYFDREGQETLRQIDTLRLGETTSGSPQILAYCHTYMRNLTFRPGSMQDCVDLDTGFRVIDVVDYLGREYAASAQASCDRVFSDYQDIFRTLAYIDQAGTVTEARVLDVLTDVCREVAGDERVSTAMVGEAMKSLQPMNREQFEVTVSRFTQMRMPIDIAFRAEEVLSAVRHPGRHAHDAKAFIDMRERLPVPI